MPDGSEYYEELTSSPHFRAICILLFKTLSQSENDILFSRSRKVTSDGLRAAIEHAALQVIRFFAIPDSADPDWLFGDPGDNVEEARPFTFSAFYHFEFDHKEMIATDLASRGDFRKLEALLESRGYLRSKEARRLVVAKLRGEKLEPKPSAKQAEIFHQITAIMVRELCSETEARKIWLTENEGKSEAASENTLKYHWGKSKNDPLLKAFLVVTEYMIDVAREKEGLPKIPSRYPRGMEKLRQLTESSHWVAD